MKDSDWGGLIWLMLLGLGAIGWVSNIIEIAHSDFVNGMVILRVIGVFFFPLGAVLGYV